MIELIWISKLWHSIYQLVIFHGNTRRELRWVDNIKMDDSSGLECGPVMSSCEHSNETLVSTERRRFSVSSQVSSHSTRIH
jgi:hypothetical protein